MVDVRNGLRRRFNVRLVRDMRGRGATTCRQRNAKCRKYFGLPRHELTTIVTRANAVLNLAASPVFKEFAWANKKGPAEASLTLSPSGGLVMFQQYTYMHQKSMEVEKILIFVNLLTFR